MVCFFCSLLSPKSELDNSYGCVRLCLAQSSFSHYFREKDKSSLTCQASVVVAGEGVAITTMATVVEEIADGTTGNTEVGLHRWRVE